MRRVFNYYPLNTDLAALFLRLIFGGMFTYIGWVKIDSYDQIKPMFTDIIGIGAELSFHLLIFAEFFCGILVLLGFLTRFSVVPIFIAMFVAFFIAHKNDQFLMKQTPFVYMLLCVVIFILGSGRYSLDALFFRKHGGPDGSVRGVNS